MVLTRFYLCRERVFNESNESMSQQIVLAVFHKEMTPYLYKSYYYLHAPEKTMDNEYQVIFLLNNGKSRSMEDKSRSVKLRRLDTTKQWRSGRVGRVKKSDLRLGVPLSN